MNQHFAPLFLERFVHELGGGVEEALDLARGNVHERTPEEFDARVVVVELVGVDLRFLFAFGRVQDVRDAERSQQRFIGRGVAVKNTSSYFKTKVCKPLFTRTIC